MATIKVPTHQTALVVQGPGKLTLRSDVSMPSVSKTGAIVRVAAVAINPVDAKILDCSPAIGAIHSHDFTGTIVALGEKSPSYLAVGDRVARSVHGNNSREPSIRAFSEYVALDEDLLLILPDSMSFEQGATIVIGLAPAVGSLYPREPSADPEFILVAGGATATGTRTIQLLNLMGLRVISTSSPSSFELARKFDAEKVFNYHSPTCASDIRDYTKNTLAYAIDCVSQADTTQLCYASMAEPVVDTSPLNPIARLLLQPEL